MKYRLAVFAALAASHLGLVACGAARVSWAEVHGIGPALQWYGAMSGAENGYGFFAPGVSAQVRPKFTLTDGQRVWEDRLEAGMSHEAQLRVGSSVSLAGMALEGEDTEFWWDYLGASWSATLFGRHPRADQVLVTIEVHDVPTMEQYRAGKRFGYLTLYQGVFTRND